MKYKRPTTVLAMIKQGNDEILKSYIDMFEVEALKRNNWSNEVLMVLLIADLCEPTDF